MKKPQKESPPLTETLIEQEEIKGKTISIYLDTESLRYLHKLCELFKMGKSQTIQFLIERYKTASLALIPLLREDQSHIADMIRKMAE